MQLLFRLPFASVRETNLVLFPTAEAPPRAYVVTFRFISASLASEPPEAITGLTWSASLHSYYQYAPQLREATEVRGARFHIPAGTTEIALTVSIWGDERRPPEAVLGCVYLEQSVGASEHLARATVLIRGES